MSENEADIARSLQRAILAELGRRGMPQRQLARRLGVSEARMSQLLRDHGNMTLAVLGRICAALGMVVTLAPAERGRDAA